MNINTIEINSLNFTYGDGEKILDGININIERGKFYTILGPNGSGKTTLVKLISKALNVQNQNIFVEGKDVNSIRNKTLATKVAVVPQYTYIDFDFSVIDIVLMGRAPHISRFASENEKDMKIVQNSMEITNTWHLRDKNINSISGGERQRVIVARAIAQETDIVILDEPISNLDIHHQIEILNQIKLLNIKKQKTIIAVLHDLNIAAAYSDNMILMNKGRIHTMGTREQVLKENIIKEVYGLDVHIISDPVTKRPVIIPLISPHEWGHGVEGPKDQSK